MPSPRATQAAISHALAAWTATVGAKPGAVEIAPDGTIRIIAAVDRIPAQEQPDQPKRWTGK